MRAPQAYVPQWQPLFWDLAERTPPELLDAEGAWIQAQAVVRAEGEARHYCSNRACPSRGAEGLKHFVSRGAMDIEGVGEKLVVKLMERGLVARAPDFYRLTRDDLLAMDGFQERSADNVIAAIDASRRQPFARVLFALGIPHVGSVTAEALADGFGSIVALRSATPEQIAEVEGVGPVIAEQVAGWFVDEEHAANVDALTAAGLQMTGPKRAQAPSGPLAGKTFVVTGTLDGFSRDGIAEHLTGLGAKVTNSISKSTDYLLAGAGGGSKRAKAEELGVAVISEAELADLVASSD